MPAPASPAPASASPPPPRGFALPGRFLVVVLFMVQFITLLLGLGGLVPYLHQQGVDAVVLGLGAVVSFAALHAVLGLAMRPIPVRCPTCGGRSRFAGFGWWPFIYRFNCGGCGTQLRIEVGGR
ncbi:MAG: hypothetical protein SF070_13020 [Gemmatimonadota bacterium]|nr:hypothetical protein [Gemmatimonadota bacterium]